MVWVRGKEEWRQDSLPEGITGTNYWQFELFRLIINAFKWLVLLYLLIWDLNGIWEKQYNAILNWYNFLYWIFINNSLESLEWNKNLLSGLCPVCWTGRSLRCWVDCMQGKQRSSCFKIIHALLAFFNTIQFFICILLKTTAYYSCKVANIPSEQLFVFCYIH